MKYCYSFYCEVRTTAPKCSIIRDQVVPERLYLSDNRHATAVSYTHLTLPTICSV